MIIQPFHIVSLHRLLLYSAVVAQVFAGTRHVRACSITSWCDRCPSGPFGQRGPSFRRFLRKSVTRRRILLMRARHYSFFRWVQRNNLIVARDCGTYDDLYRLPEQIKDTAGNTTISSALAANSAARRFWALHPPRRFRIKRSTHRDRNKAAGRDAADTRRHCAGRKGNSRYLYLSDIDQATIARTPPSC